MRAKLARLLELIEQVGPLDLKEPHVKNLGNKLWELRLSGRDGISRVIASRAACANSSIPANASHPVGDNPSSNLSKHHKQPGK